MIRPLVLTHSDILQCTAFPFPENPQYQMKGHVYLKQKKQMFVAKPCIINPCFSKNRQIQFWQGRGEIFHLLFINSRSSSVKEGEKYFTTDLGSWGLERNTFCFCLQQRSPAESDLFCFWFLMQASISSNSAEVIKVTSLWNHQKDNPKKPQLSFRRFIDRISTVGTFLIMHQLHTIIILYLQQCKRRSGPGQRTKCCSQFL